MLSKCIGIISYFPDEEPKRTNRKNSFKALIKNLDTYFKLPIVIVAQNWRDEDYQIHYCNEITVYSYEKQLGITKARAYLRDKLLTTKFDYYIFLDDDTNMTTISQTGVDNYLGEIDDHPNMVGEFKSNWLRLYAISSHMLKYMDWNYLLERNLDATKGDLWEDTAYVLTYRQLFPNKFFKFSRKDFDESFTPSEKDPNSTWYEQSGLKINRLYQTTKHISEEWVKNYGK